MTTKRFCSQTALVYTLTVLIIILEIHKIPGVISGERLRDRIYSSIEGASCFRRLNGTHQVGCSSTQSGSVGVLHYVRNDKDLEFLLNDPPAPPYAPILPPHLFTRQNILNLKEQGGRNISVVLLIDQNEQMTNFSHELQCPNQYSSIMLPNSKEAISCRIEDSWNPWGTGLLYEDLPFPIYFISNELEINKLIDCFQQYNSFDYETHSIRSLCAIEVNSFMSAAVNTEVCMRRTNFLNNLGRTHFCDPLEGKNVYATLFPRPIVNHIDRINAAERFILITARMDTTSMFDGIGLGAMDSLMGYAVLISVARSLKLLLPKPDLLKDPNLNVLFVIFNGESYDYIGSQRFIYDIENLSFPGRYTHTTPLKFDNIEFMLDLGTFDDISTIRLHRKQNFTQSHQLLEKLQKYASLPVYDFNIKIESTVGYKLPPTSAQSFLRRNISFPVCILNSAPNNLYYHSIYDDKANIKYTYMNTSRDYTTLMPLIEAFRYFDALSVQIKIRNISSVITMALYEMLTDNEYTSENLVNPLLIDEFLHCFLESSKCSLFHAASRPNSVLNLNDPPLRYISVAGSPQEASGWSYRLMGYLLSDVVENATETNCVHLPNYWFAGFTGHGECRRTTQNYSLALSPAFLIEDYDWSSGQYSTWTESTWSPFSARIFLRPARVHEIFTVSTGIVVLIISFALVYLIKSRSDVLFEDSGPRSSTDALALPTAC